MEEDVNKFIDVVDKLYKNIDTVQSSQFEDNYKKIIAFSTIDMMSKAVYGDSIYGHRNRFTKFILEFGNWEYAERISLQQLIYVISRDSSPLLNELKQYCEGLISNWPTGEPITLNNEPRYEDMVGLWPKNYKVGGKIELDYLKHVNLFYSLRNSLIHENRPLGYSFELFDMSVPYYSSRGVIKRDDSGKLVELSHEAFELSHPVKFFYAIIKNSLDNMKQYFLENQVNPYNNFRFGSEWVDS